jgi:hypothetical protein
MRAIAFAIVALLATHLFAAEAEIVSVKRIWDTGKHNAFTDLLRWHDRWWCTFREADAHVGGDGQIRVISSADGDKWESAALIAEKDIDLRDPKLSVTPDDRLMAVVGGSIYLGTKQIKGRQPRVMFSKDGREWSAPQKVLESGDWLWRVTWHDGVAYGTTYKNFDGDPTKPLKDWSLRLVTSKDGVAWEPLATWPIEGHPNETTVRFLKSGEAMAMVRREVADKKGWIGVAKPPFKEWTWKPATYQFGGPNFIELPDGRLIACTRDYKKKVSTLVAELSRDGNVMPLVTLPSGGDTSYAGLAWRDGLLWVSYYSSHEGKTSIYLAKVKLPEAKPRVAAEAR